MLKQGFTLIEIVIVFVLLGILAAVAVPKYYDLVSRGHQKAAIASIATVQSEITLSFADSLMDENSCRKALRDAKQAVDLGTQKEVGNYTLVVEDTTFRDWKNGESIDVLRVLRKGELVLEPEDGWNALLIPKCKKK